MKRAVINVPDNCFHCRHRIESNGHVPDSCYIFWVACYGGKPCDACRSARKIYEDGAK